MSKPSSVISAAASTAQAENWRRWLSKISAVSRLSTVLSPRQRLLGRGPSAAPGPSLLLLLPPLVLVLVLVLFFLQPLVVSRSPAVPLPEEVRSLVDVDEVLLPPSDSRSGTPLSLGSRSGVKVVVPTGVHDRHPLDTMLTRDPPWCFALSHTPNRHGESP